MNNSHETEKNKNESLRLKTRCFWKWQIVNQSKTWEFDSSMNDSHETVKQKRKSPIKNSMILKVASTKSINNLGIRLQHEGLAWNGQIKMKISD